MESELQQTHDTHGHHYDDHQLTAGHENEDEHQGEKKSMMTKVKDKARKVKNSIKKYRQGHGDQQLHNQDDQDDDDNDEETVEAHGVPVHDSAKVGQGGPDAVSAKPRDDLKSPSVMAEDEKPLTSSHGMPQPTVPTGAHGIGLPQPSGLGHNQSDGQEVIAENLEKPSMMGVGEESYSKPVTGHGMLSPVSTGAHGTDLSELSSPSRSQEVNSGNSKRSSEMGDDRYPKQVTGDYMPSLDSAKAHGTTLSEESVVGQNQGYDQEVIPEYLEKSSEVAEDRYLKPMTSHGMPPSVSTRSHGTGSEPSSSDHNEGYDEVNSENLERSSVITEDRYSKPVSSDGMPPPVSVGANDIGLSEPLGLGHNQGHGQEVNSENLERSSMTSGDLYPPVTSHGMAPPVSTDTHGTSLSEPSGLGQNQGSDQEVITENLERSSEMVEDRHLKPVTSHGIPPPDSAKAHGTDLFEPSGPGNETGLSKPLGPGHNQGHGQEVDSENLERSSMTSGDLYSPVTSHGMAPPVSADTHGTSLSEPSGLGQNQGSDQEVIIENLERSSEMVEDRHLKPMTSHGIPPPDSAKAHGTDLSEPSGPGPNQGYGNEASSGHLEKSSEMTDHCDSKPVTSHGVPPPISAGDHGTDISQPSGLGHNQDYGQELNSENLERSSEMEEGHKLKSVSSQDMPPPISAGDHDATLSQPSVPSDNQGYNQEINSENLVTSSMMAEDKPVTSHGMQGVVPGPHAPKDPTSLGLDPSNHATKFVNPTNIGGKEGELSEFQHSFDNEGIDSEPNTLDHNHPEHLPHKTLIGNPPTKSSTHASKISSSPFSPKDTIPSKLGYSGQSPTTKSHESVKDSSPATGYAQTITKKDTGMLEQDFDKVADTGSPVTSKVEGSVFGTEQPQVQRGPEVDVVDKGMSGKEHLVDTLKPRDEDKALSEVIRPGTPEKISDEDRPKGTVIESDEAQRQQETGHQREDEHDSGNVVADKSMTERVRGAVSSWFGGEKTAPQETPGTSSVTDKRTIE